MSESEEPSVGYGKGGVAPGQGTAGRKEPNQLHFSAEARLRQLHLLVQNGAVEGLPEQYQEVYSAWAFFCGLCTKFVRADWPLQP